MITHGVNSVKQNLEGPKKEEGRGINLRPLKFLSTMALCICSLYVSIAQAPSAESKFQRHGAPGVTKEDCRAIGIVMQDFGEVISNETCAMGMNLLAAELRGIHS